MVKKLVKCRLMFSTFLIMVIGSFALYGQQEDAEKIVLNQETIIHIAYQNHPKIKAAQYRFQSAEYNYKLFESEYAQFSPVNVQSQIRRRNNEETTSELAFGLEKEFFDGSSVSVYTGNETESYSGQLDHTQFVEGKVEFPLFSSNRKLNRIIKRTFEENELFSAHLEYIETIRETVLDALEKYYNIIPNQQQLEMLQKYKNLLKEYLEHEQIKTNHDHQIQIIDEIKALESDIKNTETNINSNKIQLKRWLAIDSLQNYFIQPISLDLQKWDYFGKFYVEENFQAIYERAMANDTEIMVLDLVVENAKEKKKLAKKGKWDIFASARGRYNYYGYNDDKYANNGYDVILGLDIKRFDKSLLNYSILKAESDILAVEAQIEDRKHEMAAKIKEAKQEVEQQRKQLVSIIESYESRKQVFDIKSKNYLDELEPIDNMIMAFRELVDTEDNYFETAEDYFENIRDLDYLCGIYFEELGIKIN